MRTRVGNVMSESSRLHATPASLSTGCICKSKNIAGCLFTLGILSLHRRITSVDFGGQDIFARKCMYARILLDIWPKNIFPILGGGGQMPFATSAPVSYACLSTVWRSHYHAMDLKILLYISSSAVY